MSPQHTAISSPIATRLTTVLACSHPGCDRQFTRKYTLEEHMKSHTGERPHVCPVRTCGKRFKTSGNLSRHKRLHGYIEPIPCPVEGCVCAFPTNKKLEKHLKFHYGSGVKVCSVVDCGKTFSTTGNLNRHLKNYHSEEDILENLVKVMSVSIGSPMNGDRFDGSASDSVDPTMDVFAHMEPMSDDFSQLSQFDDMEDIWSPAVLDTLQTILSNEPSWCC